MSLSERAQQGDRGTFGFDGSDGCVTDSRAFIFLKNQVNGVVSTDEIARIMAKSPKQARNEIRYACEQAFAHPFWSDVPEHRRNELVEAVIDGMFGFGPIEGMLADDSITEIMINGTASIFYERRGKLYRSDVRFTQNDQVMSIVDRIISPLGRRIDESSPMVNARLPQGYRVNAVIPPLAIDGPVVTIRKFSEKVLTLEDMKELGSMDDDVVTFMRWAVLMRKNIAVSGGTGSGKTTLLNALSCEIPFDERIVTIEDSAELRFLEHPHVVRLEARSKNSEGRGQVTIRDLVMNSLRMRPDRIVVGEVRGGEALDMLQAMNTGHDGSLTTLHANSPREVVSRLETMVRYAADLSVDVIEAYIASAIDVVVQTARAIDGSRYVSEIVSFSYDQEHRACKVEELFKRAPLAECGVWVRVPEWIDDVAVYRRASRMEVQRWRGSLRFAS